MNILLITDILFTGDFAKTLENEGNDVRVFIADKNSKNNLDNILTKTKSWKKDLEWVGKDGLIIFEDVGDGKIQDKLREKGYTVFGTSEIAEKTELDREFGQKVFEESGLNILKSYNFKNIDKAIDFIKNNPNHWVIKYSNGHMNKNFNHVGNNKQGKDIIAILENIKHHSKQRNETVTVQERAIGVEIGVGRYFNGKDWVGPIEYNLEHTHLFPNNIGPNVDEMGTLAWFDNDEDEILYKQILAPIKEFLQKANFRGDYEINCIVNENGIFPLEATARLGSPIIHIHERMFDIRFSDFLMALAKGESFDVAWKKGFCIVVSCVTTPFPYPYAKEGDSVKGLPVFIDEDVTEEELHNIHLDEIASIDGTHNTLYICGTSGSSVYITGKGDTVEEARHNAYNLIKKINIPKMFYRHDIGADFMEKRLPLLQSYGYLKNLK
jgi:phosphoribosylamine--glycine ligase